MDLIDKSEKNTLSAEIQAHYERRNKALLEQNKKLREYALDTAVAGGIADTILSRGVYKKDFATPYAQSLIAEEMANEGYFALALKQFVSLCRSVEVELKYKSKELNEDIRHKKVLNFVKDQINNIGGYDNIFEKVIEPSLRWGVGVAVPDLVLVNKELIGFQGIKTINMQNIQQFIFNKDDASKISALKYITYPKVVDTGLEDYIDGIKIDKTETTKVDYITVDIKENCIAYHAHNASDGNPFGTFYLYFLYSYFKLYKKLTEGMYNAVHSFGNYPMGVRRTNTATGEDKTEWENDAVNKLQDLMSQGGGIYVDGEGELYNITPPDTSNMSMSLKDIFDMTMRTASLGQITAGIDGGGSRNLTQSMDAMTDSFVLATIKSACIDISETMIKSLCDLNFKKDYRLGKLKEYPRFIVKDKTEIIDEVKERADKIAKETGTPLSPFQSAITKPASMNKQDTNKQDINKYYTNKQDINNTKAVRKEVVKQGVLTDIIEQEGYETTFKLVKREPNDIEKQIIYNVKSLDDILSKSKEELSNVLGTALKPKIKEALEKIAKNPKANLNVWGIFDKKRFAENIHNELEHIVRTLALEEAKYIEASFNLGNTTFEDVLGESMDDFINKAVKNYLKSDAVKNIETNLIQNATQYVREYATKVSNGFGINSKELRMEGLRRALADVDDLKGVEFDKLAEMEVMKTFTSLSEHENKEAMKKAKNKNYVIMRSGILEGQCEHCQERMGDIYYLSDDGENFINNRGEHAVFPDPHCVGMEYGNTCRCFGLLTPKGILGETVE